MKIGLTGGSGLIGRHLSNNLRSKNIVSVPFRRVNVNQENPPAEDPWWDPLNAKAHIPKELELDALVHLGGEPIAEHRWNPDIRSRIYSSRVFGTRGIVEAISQHPSPPKVLVSASAIGFYGDRGPEVLTEASPPGSGFLSKVCQDWEGATSLLDQSVTRPVLIRTGIVLAKDGGVLGKLITPFKFALGATLGNGQAWMSWIHIHDHVRAIEFLINSPEANGPFNLVAPVPVQNAEFTEALSKALGRRSVLRLPDQVLELALGTEMARETVLASQHVIPESLLKNGFNFEFQNIEAALAEMKL